MVFFKGFDIASSVCSSAPRLTARRARTRDCRADAQVCRAGVNCSFEIAGHPGRDPGGVREDTAHGVRVAGEPFEGCGRFFAQGGDSHDSPDPQPATPGGVLGERNVNRSWEHLRRKAQAVRVRPLRLHDARHTFATLALASG